jgi:hypothetical protein
MTESFARDVENHLYTRHPQVAIPIVSDEHEGLASERVGRWLIAAHARRWGARQTADRLAQRIAADPSRWPIN